MKLPDLRCPPHPDPLQETRTAWPAAPGVLTCTGSRSASRQTGPPSASPGWTPAKRIGRAEREAAWPRWRGRQPPRSESRPRTAQVRGRRLPGPQGSGRVCGMVSVSAAGGADSALILRTVHAPRPERAGSPDAGRGPCASVRVGPARSSLLGFVVHSSFSFGVKRYPRNHEHQQQTRPSPPSPLMRPWDPTAPQHGRRPAFRRDGPRGTF